MNKYSWTKLSRDTSTNDKREYIKDFKDRSCSTCSYRNKCTLVPELLSMSYLLDTEFVFACWFRDLSEPSYELKDKQ